MFRFSGELAALKCFWIANKMYFVAYFTSLRFLLVPRVFYAVLNAVFADYDSDTGMISYNMLLNSNVNVLFCSVLCYSLQVSICIFCGFYVLCWEFVDVLWLSPLAHWLWMMMWYVTNDYAVFLLHTYIRTNVVKHQNFVCLLVTCNLMHCTGIYTADTVDSDSPIILHPIYPT